jgi:hypothetical protein
MHTVLVGKPEGNITLRRTRNRWEENGKEIGCESVNWIHVA